VAKFNIPNLCGASPELNALTSKVDDIKKDILAKLDLPASDIASSVSGKLTELKAAFDNLSLDLPDVPNVNFQSELTGLINDIPKDTIAGLAAFSNKLAELELDFGPTLKEKGLSLPNLVTEATDQLAAGGDVCALAPNIEISAANSGTGVTTEEKEQVVSTGLTVVAIAEDYKTLVSVEGKSVGSNFFSGISGYKVNGRTLTLPKSYEQVKIKYIISLIKEKAVEVKQATLPPEKETVSIVSPNSNAVSKKSEFKLNNLIKKLDSATAFNLPTEKINADITKATNEIKSDSFKAKMKADLAFAAAERKKLFADPLNYKQVVVPAPSAGEKSRVVKVTTPEVQNTVKTETVTKPNPVTKKVETVRVKKTEKSTIAINGIAMRKVMIKEKFVTSERADKGWPLVSDMSKLTLKHIPYQIDSVTARPYLKPNSEGITGIKKGVGLYSYNNPQIYGDRSSNDDEKVIVDGTKTITLEPVNKVKQQTVLKITYIILEKLDPNFKG